MTYWLIQRWFIAWWYLMVKSLYRTSHFIISTTRNFNNNLSLWQKPIILFIKTQWSILRIGNPMMCIPHSHTVWLLDKPKSRPLFLYWLPTLCSEFFLFVKLDRILFLRANGRIELKSWSLTFWLIYGRLLTTFLRVLFL